MPRKCLNIIYIQFGKFFFSFIFVRRDAIACANFVKNVIKKIITKKYSLVFWSINTNGPCRFKKINNLVLNKGLRPHTCTAFSCGWNLWILYVKAVAPYFLAASFTTPTIVQKIAYKEPFLVLKFFYFFWGFFSNVHRAN